MRYRLAGSLSLVACCLLGLMTQASAQEYAAGPTMAPYSPAWSMPPGSIPPGAMPPGMMQGQGMPPGMMGGQMPPGMMQGQGMPPGLMGGQMPPGMAQQAAFQDPGMGYGNEAPMDQAYPDGGCAPAGCGDNCDGCDSCCGATPAGLARRGLLKRGGGGFARRPGPFGGGGRDNDGLLSNAFGFRWMRFFLPADDGGAAAVRWFDASVDYLLYKRDDVGADRVFARLGQDVNGPIALASNQLEFPHESGFRFMANIQFGSANSFEFVYFGVNNRANPAEAFDQNSNLTSVLSNFATFPAGGFAETDFGDLQRLEYSSELDNFELNYRTRWMSPECRYQGSWLAGVRFIKFDDDLLYQTFTANDRMDFLTNTNNSMTGFQLGGDLWVCLVPGLRLGIEGKAGVYGNYSRAGAIINTTAPFQYVEDSQSSDAAFVGELNMNMLYRLNYNWTFRLGYNFLVLEGVALATDNFNATPPNAFANNQVNQLRVPSVSNNSDVLYHGLNLGLEYMW